MLIECCFVLIQLSLPKTSQGVVATADDDDEEEDDEDENYNTSKMVG